MFLSHELVHIKLILKWGRNENIEGKGNRQEESHPGSVINNTCDSTRRQVKMSLQPTSFQDGDTCGETNSRTELPTKQEI